MFKRRIRTEPLAPKMGDRRRDTRRPVGWGSRYLVTDETRSHLYITDSDYSECVLRDLTTAGAGLHCADSEIAIGDRILLDLKLGERHGASIKVTGEVRHASCTDDGEVRAGIEFVDVGDLERAILFRFVRDLPARQPQNA